MNKAVLLFLIAIVGPAVLGSACLAVALVSATHDAEMHRLDVNGVLRTYYLHVPAGLPSGAPLVIMLHGDGNDGRKILDDLGWEAQADLNHFVVAGPDGSRAEPGGKPDRHNRRGWNSGVPGEPPSIERSDDVGFIVAMIDDIARIAGIDRRRVYVAGFSSGGHMANRLGQEIAGRLAAISTSASDLTSLSKPPSRGISVLFSAGDRDPLTPVERQKVMTIWGGASFIKESQRALVDRWRTLDACPAARTIPSPANTIIEVSGPCRDGSEVRYILMQGVAHAWPLSRPIDLTRTSWDFFKRFSLPAKVAD
jgi:polyhydroxybutyrate depolymerase